MAHVPELRTGDPVCVLRYAGFKGQVGRVASVPGPDCFLVEVVRPVQGRREYVFGGEHLERIGEDELLVGEVMSS